VYPGILAVEAAFQGLMLMALKHGIIRDLSGVSFVPGEQPLTTKFVDEIRKDHKDLMLHLNLSNVRRGILSSWPLTGKSTVTPVS